MKKILEKIYELKNKGFFSIVISSTIVKAIMFLSAMFLPRFLSKNSYGTLSYSETIISYLLLISGFGLSNATLKYGSLTDDKKYRNRIFFSTNVIGTIFNIIFAVIAFGIIFISPSVISEAKVITITLLGIPFITFLFQNSQMLFRSEFENNKYSILSIIYTLLYVGLQIAGAIVKDITGVVVGRYIALTASFIIAILMIKDTNGFTCRMVENTQILQMLKYSIAVLIGNFFSTAILNNEVLILGNVFKNTSIIADYRVSSYALQICNFLADSIMIYEIPFFARNERDKKWIWSKYKKIVFANGIIVGLIVIILFTFSKEFISIIWGSAYINAVPVMKRLLIAAFFTTTLRVVAGNVLSVIGKEKFTLMINAISCVSHFGIDICVYKTLGERGIGYGLTLVYLCSGLAMMIELYRYCHEMNKLENEHQ
jgi:O-antigen/teichoic acid export membrane protein